MEKLDSNIVLALFEKEQYRIVEGIYLNIRSRLTIQCNKNHEPYEIKTESFWRGYGRCRECKGLYKILNRDRVQLPPPVEGAKWIPLSRGLFSLIDEEDYERVSKHSWHATHGTDKTLFYASTNIKGKTTKLHRFILNLKDPKIHVDHIDHQELNNRKNNLRICTNQENSRNKLKKSDRSSKYKGVTWDKSRDKWIVGIKINYVRNNLGRYADEIEAAKVYDRAAVKHFGEFSLLNFPELINEYRKDILNG